MNTELNTQPEEVTYVSAPSEPEPFDPEKCNYVKYARSEFELVNITDPEIIEPVLLALTEIGKEGHSGGSMGWFSGVFLKWSEDPVEPSAESMLLPIWNIIKNVTPEKRKDILYYIYRTMTFKPLGPLTGADEEWIVHDYDDGTMKQNKRHSSVFMRTDGSCYDIDGIVHCYPYTDYTGWHGVGGRFSLVDVSFPYTVPNHPEYKYFEDDEWKNQIPNGTEDQWLSNACEKFNYGQYPDGSLNESVWLGTKEEAEEALAVFNEVKDLPIWDDHHYFFSDVFFPCPRDQKSIDAGQHYVFKIEGYDKLVSQKTGRMLVRLITQYKGTKFNFKVAKAFQPGEHYQTWWLRGYTIIAEKMNGNLYYDGLFHSISDGADYKYLYEKCKEKNLKYKGPRK